MSCGHCSLDFNNDDFLTCGGICERSFHGRISCSGIRNDVAKSIQKHKNLIHYVCADCRKVKLCHVLDAVKICTTHVKDLDAKFDVICDKTASSLIRVSALETSINDVSVANDTFKFDDDAFKKVEKVINESLRKFMTGFDCKLRTMMSDMNKLPEKLNVASSLSKVNLLLEKLDTSIDAKDLRMENLSSTLLNLRNDCEKIVQDSDTCVNLSKSFIDSNVLTKFNDSVKVIENELVDNIVAANDKLIRNIEQMESKLMQFVDSSNDAFRRFSSVSPIVVPRPEVEMNQLSTIDESVAQPESFVTIDESIASLTSDEMNAFTESLAELDDLCSSFTTLDVTGFSDNSECVILSSHDDDEILNNVSQQPSESLPSDNKEEYQWVYVASADQDFCLKRLRNLIYWNFGLDDLRIDKLTRKCTSDVTYQSFKVSVPISCISNFLDHKNWPSSYYVRRFGMSTKSNFRPALDNDLRRRRHHFVHNPSKLRI